MGRSKNSNVNQLPPIEQPRDTVHANRCRHRNVQAMEGFFDVDYKRRSNAKQNHSAPASFLHQADPSGCTPFTL
jgi:hypothetical protein